MKFPYHVYPIWPHLSDHNLEKTLCGGLLEKVIDELQRKESGSFREDGTVVCFCLWH